MKRSMMAWAAAALLAISTPALSATITATGTSINNPSTYNVGFSPAVGSGVSFATSSIDFVQSSRNAATRFFEITYSFVAPLSGLASFNFLSQSTQSSALNITGFGFGSSNSSLQAPVNVNAGSNPIYVGNSQLQVASGSNYSVLLQGNIRGGASNRGSLVSSVSFASAVPELSTWLMMIIGVGMVGTTLRVRRFQEAYSFSRL